MVPDYSGMFANMRGSNCKGSSLVYRSWAFSAPWRTTEAQELEVCHCIPKCRNLYSDVLYGEIKKALTKELFIAHKINNECEAEEKIKWISAFFQVLMINFENPILKLEFSGLY